MAIEVITGTEGNDGSTLDLCVVELARLRRLPPRAFDAQAWQRLQGLTRLALEEHVEAAQRAQLILLEIEKDAGTRPRVD